MPKQNHHSSTDIAPSLQYKVITKLEAKLKMYT